ncbi:hypothetical protein LJ739_15110 [Aestuariibacter halophilus]|uniref:Uncharacterized protein n=1 Tax=Fluctibacter halophilus TaxID=226011 RepID=A0ABS8GED4_9ALTE|nr:hypothetical protein [Aestuariibacter halophilus]MCC2617581.1 hypothetical protein [Aestuariibacter halophilus]
MSKDYRYTKEDWDDGDDVFAEGKNRKGHRRDDEEKQQRAMKQRAKARRRQNSELH